MNQALLYSKYNSLQKSDVTFVLNNYFGFINWKNGGDIILDIGCGSGDVTCEILFPLLPKTIGKLIGADISQEMVEFAKDRYKNPNVSFAQMNIGCESLPKGFEGYFDHIFSFYCLHWVQNQRQAFDNILKLLKPGGDVLLTFLASNPIFDIYERLSKQGRWHSYMNDFHRYVSPYQYSKNPQADLETMLSEIGFSAYSCQVEDRIYVYPNVAVLKKSVMAVNPFLGEIPEDMKEQYISDYLNEVKKMDFIEYNNNNEETVQVPYKLFIVCARK